MQREHRESQIKVTLLNTFDTSCIIYKSKSNETKHLNTFKILQMKQKHHNPKHNKELKIVLYDVVFSFNFKT